MSVRYIVGLLLILGAVGCFGLSQRDSVRSQPGYTSTYRGWVPEGPEREVPLSFFDRAAYMVTGLVLCLGGIYCFFMPRTQPRTANEKWIDVRAGKGGPGPLSSGRSAPEPGSSHTTHLPKEKEEELINSTTQLVDALILRLPEDLRPEALRIGYALRNTCRDDPDTLGQYLRSAELIILYVQAIQEHAIEQSSDFAEEVKITYLHELGHHLGLNEKEVERRGL